MIGIVRKFNVKRNDEFFQVFFVQEIDGNVILRVRDQDGSLIHISATEVTEVIEER